MNFWKRLRYYVVGIGIGSLMVLFFFGDRGCGGWLPGNRIKTSLMTSKFQTSDLIDCKLECNGFTAQSVADLISDGEVILSKSKRDTNPREYVIIHEGKTLLFAVNTDMEAPVYIIDQFELNCPECAPLLESKSAQKYDRYIKLPFRKTK